MSRNKRVPLGPLGSVILSMQETYVVGVAAPGATSVRSKRFAGDSSVSLQPERARGKASARTREKRSPRFSIGLEPSLVSPQRFNAPPQVLASHAWRHLPSRLARAWAVTPVLIEDATPPNDSFARPRPLGCGLALDGRDPFLKACGEFATRQLLQPTRKMKRKRHGIRQSAIGTKERLRLGGRHGPVGHDGAERANSGPMMSLLDQEIFHWIRKCIDHLGDDVVIVHQLDD